jgi:DNA-binding NtrC family response regulator
MVSDIGLPGMNGRQLADLAHEILPGLKVLLVTGYAESAAIRGQFLGPGMELLTKPFTLDALGTKIREMIEVRPTQARRAPRGPRRSRKRTDPGRFG